MSRYCVTKEAAHVRCDGQRCRVKDTPSEQNSVWARQVRRNSSTIPISRSKSTQPIHRGGVGRDSSINPSGFHEGRKDVFRNVSQ